MRIGVHGHANTHLSLLFIVVLISCSKSEKIVEPRLEHSCVGLTCNIGLTDVTLLKHVNSLGIVKETRLSGTPVILNMGSNIIWHKDNGEYPENDHLENIGLLTCNDGKCSEYSNPTSWIFDNEGEHHIRVSGKIVNNDGKVIEIDKEDTIVVTQGDPIIDITKTGNVSKQYTLHAYTKGMGHEENTQYEWYVKESSQDDSNYALAGNGESVVHTFGNINTFYTVKLKYSHTNALSKEIVKQHKTDRMYPQITVTDNNDGTFEINVTDENGVAIDPDSVDVNWIINGNVDNGNNTLNPTIDFSNENGGTDNTIGIVIKDPDTGEILYTDTITVTTPVKKAAIRIKSKDDGQYIFVANTEKTGLNKIDSNDIEYHWAIDKSPTVKGQQINYNFNEDDDPDFNHEVVLETFVKNNSIGSDTINFTNSSIDLKKPKITINTNGVFVEQHSRTKNPVAANIVIDFNGTMIDNTWDITITYDDEGDQQLNGQIVDGKITIPNHIFERTLYEYNIKLIASKKDDSGVTIIRKAQANYATSKAITPFVEIKGQPTTASINIKIHLENTGINSKYWVALWGNVTGTIQTTSNGKTDISTDDTELTIRPIR
ncbi:hypothetical protein QIW49_08995 [Francisellaceae bacterium CB300]